jgi:hypothetical protein
MPSRVDSACCESALSVRRRRTIGPIRVRAKIYILYKKEVAVGEDKHLLAGLSAR